jgi:hypothetical protein
MESEDLK